MSAPPPSSLPSCFVSNFVTTERNVSLRLLSTRNTTYFFRVVKVRRVSSEGRQTALDPVGESVVRSLFCSRSLPSLCRFFLCAGLGGLRASRGVLFMFRRDRLATDGTGLGCSVFAVFVSRRLCSWSSLRCHVHRNPRWQGSQFGRVDREVTSAPVPAGFVITVRDEPTPEEEPTFQHLPQLSL